MKARKGCWTCTDRKVQCDGGLPTCQKCSRVGRKCQGYEMRLSWPKDNDKKRAIISHLPQVMLGAGPGPNPFFINTTWRDVELHSRQFPQVEWLSETAASSPDLSTEPQLSASHIDLVQYFYNTAYLSLITFGVDPSQLRDVLLRTATTGNSVSRLAVLNALLAFSSLHLSGLHHDTIQLKISALHYLSASAKKEMLNRPEAAQHLAASMLLGSFEILTPSESSGEWIWYIWGALNIVEATHLEYQSHETDLGQLLDWLDYHNLLSRFSIHHWRHKSLTLEAPHVNYPGPLPLQYSSLAKYIPTMPAPNPTYVILNLLSEIYDTSFDQWDPRFCNEEYSSRLVALEDRIGSLPIMAVSTSFGADDAIATQVYQLAARIYMARASQSSWKQSTKIDCVIDNIFAGPLPGHACGHFFPVFVLTCEARTDDRRMAILNLLDRTERNTQIRSLRGLRHTVESIWVQQDLHADSDLLVNYLSMMSAVSRSGDSSFSWVLAS